MLDGHYYWIFTFSIINTTNKGFSQKRDLKFVIIAWNGIKNWIEKIGNFINILNNDRKYKCFVFQPIHVPNLHNMNMSMILVLVIVISMIILYFII